MRVRKQGLLMVALYLGLCSIHRPLQVLAWQDETTSPSTATESITQPNAEQLAFFESKIRPLLIDRCVECHSDADPESGLSLESKAGLFRGGKLGTAVVPGKPKESLLFSAVNHDEFLKMPPKDKLATADLAALSKWVAMGAPWPDNANPTKPPVSTPSPTPSEHQASPFSDEQRQFWAYQPIRRPDAPETEDVSAGQNPIDAFIQARLRDKGISPSPVASKADLIRRASYDLTGLPPDEEDIQSFVADTSPDAFAKVIDRLLASPRYGERWGRHWLDVARFADSNGLDENIAYANAFRYRDYVIASLNQDKPYDRFVQEQIAGDLLGPDPDSSDPLDRFVGTGFLAIGAKMLAEDDPVKMQMDIIDEQLSVLCQAFMGITIGCARCHDHKFDPFQAADYYALAGIFKSSQTMENHKVVARWYERPIATDEQLEEIRRCDEEIAVSKKQLAEVDATVRERVRDEIRKTVAPSLIAAQRYEAFSARSLEELGKGQNQSDQPYRVDSGYALIEAEGFHRGGAIRDLDNYGKDIGVLISAGPCHVEYDIHVEHAGTYALEIRYAAEERRPLKLYVDGKEVTPPVAGMVTGGWYPDSQNWFVTNLLNLSAGRHVIQFESRRVFPHLDKFALVYQTTVDQAWPFGQPPLALSRASLELGVPYPIVALWRTYLNKLKNAEPQPEMDPLFQLWVKVIESKSSFDETWQKIASELNSDSPMRNRTPAMLREVLAQTPPRSLDELAALYQSLIQRWLPLETTDEKAKGELNALLGTDSPLFGPQGEMEKFYTSQEQTRAEEFNQRIADIESRRPNPPMAMGVTESQPEDLKIHMRGSHLVLGTLVSRRVPKVLSHVEQPPIGSGSSGRLELAQWITNPHHPLTARVMANRIWHWHFGRGIVPSVDNFGLLGLKPTHPELLDWLASELMDNQWSIKHMHRTIMLSRTYQTSGLWQATASEVDPENELLWRFRRRRLTAEETRDSIIAVGTGLDQLMGGSLMKTENHTYVNNTTGINAIDYSGVRRTVYLPVIRSGVFDVLQTLDFPDPAMINGERQTSTVAPQALMMMNSDLVAEQTLEIAKQLQSESADDATRIATVYRRILKRSPSDVEKVASLAFLEKARLTTREATVDAGQFEINLWQAFSRVLISSNEFSYIE